MRRTPKSVRLRMKTRQWIARYGVRVAFSLGMLTVLIGLSIWIFPPLKYYVTDVFRVREIRFSGVYYNDVAPLKQAVSAWVGRNFWEVDREALRRAVEAVPWVASARVSAVPGSRITVVVTEKQPVAVYRDEKQNLWIVDTTGERIARFNPDFAYRNFPIVSCSEEELPGVVRKFERLSTGEKALFLSRLSELVVKSPDSKWVCYLRDVPWPVYVDPFGMFRNVDRFLRVEKFIRARYDRIDYIDLSFQNQIVVKPE